MAEEQIFLNENNVFVSNTRVILHGTTYATANITSVAKRRTPANTGCAVILIVFGVMAVLVALTGFAGDNPGGAFGGLVISGAILAAGIFWLRSLKPTYHVYLASASAERHGLSSQDQALVDRVTNAISDAITYRG
jgi:hypothetical protein